MDVNVVGVQQQSECEPKVAAYGGMAVFNGVFGECLDGVHRTE